LLAQSSLKEMPFVAAPLAAGRQIQGERRRHDVVAGRGSGGPDVAAGVAMFGGKATTRIG